MKINLHFISLIFFILISSSILSASNHLFPQSWNEFQSNDGWELIKETERVKVYNKQLGVFPLPAYRAEITSDVEIERLVDAAWLVEKSIEVFPNAFIIDAGIY